MNSTRQVLFTFDTLDLQYIFHKIHDFFDHDEDVIDNLHFESIEHAYNEITGGLNNPHKLHINYYGFLVTLDYELGILENGYGIVRVNMFPIHSIEKDPSDPTKLKTMYGTNDEQVGIIEKLGYESHNFSVKSDPIYDYKIDKIPFYDKLIGKNLGKVIIFYPSGIESFKSFCECLFDVKFNELAKLIPIQSMFKTYQIVPDQVKAIKFYYNDKGLNIKAENTVDTLEFSNHPDWIRINVESVYNIINENKDHDILDPSSDIMSDPDLTTEEKLLKLSAETDGREDEQKFGKELMKALNEVAQYGSVSKKYDDRIGAWYYTFEGTVHQLHLNKQLQDLYSDNNWISDIHIIGVPNDYNYDGPNCEKFRDIVAMIMFNENIKVSVTFQKSCKWYDRDDLEFPLTIKQKVPDGFDDALMFKLSATYEIGHQKMLNQIKNLKRLDLDNFEIVK